jgi:RNA polymerase sigma-70 factor (ECF subfamily)
VRSVTAVLPDHPAESAAAPASDDRVTALYREYGPAIFARCRRLLEDVAAAEDATQETFLRVRKHLERAPDGRQALAWIYRIATNYCLNEIRNRKVRAEPREHLPEQAAEPRSVEDALANEDLARRLIRRAPEKLRVVAWLYHVDGMEQAEIATVLDISRRTVVNRLAEFEDKAKKFVQRTGSAA